jgi:hypothetical protein
MRYRDEANVKSKIAWIPAAAIPLLGDEARNTAPYATALLHSDMPNALRAVMNISI